MSRKWNLSWIGVFVIFATILAYLSMPAFSVSDSGERETAPTFVVSDLAGTTKTLGDFLQKVKIINFWATWCHACKLEIPALRAIHEKYKEQGVTVIGMSVDQDPNSVVQFVEETGIEYPMLVNAMEAAQSYHLRATPTTLILDENNNVYKKYVGVQGQGTFERDIEALLTSS
jgi:thiol-disulfide isomerase/thioredoxin